MSTKKEQTEKVDTEQVIDYRSMSLFERLSLFRAEMYEKGFSKGAENKFKGFKYFELADFVPTAIALCTKYGLFPKATPIDGVWTMTIYDVWKNPSTHTDMLLSEITFYMPLKDIDDKPEAGMTRPQWEGAKQTYARKYLWMQALELSEADKIDSLNPEDVKKHADKSDKSAEKPKQDTIKIKPISEEERKEVYRRMHGYLGGDKKEIVEIFNQIRMEFKGDESKIYAETASSIGLETMLKKFKKVETDDDGIPLFKEQEF